MSLWGTAIDAEVRYRQEELKKAWGGRPRKAPKDEKRGAQIRRGLSGMRPQPAHRGLFA
ncbi:hypothetical protein [Myceligenerans salitolerans]|uniref:Uncharacterized protein n=1 Tax=Myceligenerans salitolerans TaxID=1230528 RepID=A0ABS3I6A4_9MICO|nr:hypothetical protein [Myceligenerans salitolerans]MBO0608532.1 hypothetical protein [Myceligenerans salitolerans]